MTPADWPNPKTNSLLNTRARTRSVRALGIASPVAGREIVISDDVPADRQRVPLRAAGASATSDVHWFIDGEHVAVGSADATSWWSPAPGRHEVRAVDAAGHSARVTISVRGR
jgi:membrane carboxypeptidase/penicillin-binding protein PbpC